MMTFAEYLEKFPTGSKYLLLELDPDDTFLRLSGGGYHTSPQDPTLPNTTFKARIASNGVPRMSRSVGDILGGKGVNSWGAVTLTTGVYSPVVDIASLDTYGMKAVLRLIGPPDVVQYADSTVALIGYVTKKSGTVEQALTLHLSDRGRLLSRSVAVERYVAADQSAYFPVSNEGKVKPIVLGKCKNVPTVLIDTDLDKYQVSDIRWPIDDIKYVYVNGVSVGFTKVLAENSFTLAAPVNANEIVTAEVWGVTESSVLQVTHTQIITWLLKTFSTFFEDTQLDVSGLPSGDAQYYIAEEVQIDRVLDDLTKSCLASYYATADDKLKIRTLPVVSPGGRVLRNSQYLQEITWEEQETVYHSVPYTYNNNFSPLSVLGAVPDKNFELWLREGSGQDTEFSASTLATYPNSTTAPAIRTFFVNKSDAQMVAEAAQAAFGVVRLKGSIRVPYSAPALEVFDSVELTSAGPLTGDCLLLSVTEDHSGITSVMNLEVFK